MLVLPSDSGYNSPCDGIGPSSLHSLSKRLSQPDISMKVCRKLRFESHTCWNSGSYSPSKSSNRSREIARRLIEMCDSLEKEFSEANENAEDPTWTASILRLIGF